MAIRDLVDDTMAGWERERPDLDLAAMGSMLRVTQLMNVALRGAEAVFAPHGITAGEFDVLAALRRGGRGTSLAPSTLARVAMISPAGMTNRLDRLEAAGLIARRPDPDDRRGSLVELTATGYEIADRAIEDLVTAENAVFAGLSRSDRERFDRILGKLIDQVERLQRDRSHVGARERRSVARSSS